MALSIGKNNVFTLYDPLAHYSGPFFAAPYRQALASGVGTGVQGKLPVTVYHLVNAVRLQDLKLLHGIAVQLTVHFSEGQLISRRKLPKLTEAGGVIMSGNDQITCPDRS